MVLGVVPVVVGPVFLLALGRVMVRVVDGGVDSCTTTGVLVVFAVCVGLDCFVVVGCASFAGVVVLVAAFPVVRVVDVLVVVPVGVVVLM